MIESIKAFLEQGANLVGSFGPRLLLVLFIICLIGESSSLSVPYLFETVLLMTGYHLTQGNLTALEVFVMLLSTQLGRQVGVLALYGAVGGGTSLLSRQLERLRSKLGLDRGLPSRLLQRINLLSVFSVAVGMLLWLRVPLAIILSAKRAWKTLLPATLISGLVYDLSYIILGAVVGVTVKQQPFLILLYFLAGLTAIFILTLTVRKILERLTRRHGTAT